MSRSNYSDDCDGWDLIRWRGAVAAAIRSRRGQAFLLEMWNAMTKMPEQKLVANELSCADGVCAIGSVGRERGIDMTGIDPEDSDKVAEVFGIAPALAREIVFENDEATAYNETPEERFRRMKKWIEEHLQPVVVDTCE